MENDWRSKDSHRKKHLNILRTIFLAILILCIIVLVFRYYYEKRTSAENLPIRIETLQDALTSVGLSWEVAEVEQLWEGHLVYELVNETGKSIAVLSSVADPSKRLLQMNFLSSGEISDALPFEDWEKAVRLATILYGNFDRDDQVYQTFLDTYEEDMMIDDVPGDASKRKRLRWFHDINGIRCFLGFCQQKLDSDFTEAEFVSILFSNSY